jgi:hypothetical protein
MKDLPFPTPSANPPRPLRFKIFAFSINNQKSTIFQ